MTVRELLQELAVPQIRQQLGALAGSPGLDRDCAGVTHDSRRVIPGAVFVALRGRTVDGVQFAAAAVQAGAALIVAELEAPLPVANLVPWLVVPDARLVLALLAAGFYGHPSRRLRVVGITGTNGKTTTSFLLREIFETAGMKTGLVGTVTYGVGDQEVEATRTTPEAPDLQLLLKDMVEAGCGACVMEVSSHALALRRVDGVHFAAAVFTNLTRDHLDFHADMEDYFSAKRRLFEMLPTGAPGVVNADDPRGMALTAVVSRPVTYAIQARADVMPGPLSLSVDGLHFDARTPVGMVSLHSALVGRPNVYNVLAAVAAAVALDLPLTAIERGVARLTSVPGRFETVSSPADDLTVVVDYAHTDDALRNVLETAKSLTSGRLVTVVGAGGDRDRTKRPLMGMVAARLSDVLIITSDNPRGEDPARIAEEVKRGADPEARQGGAEVRTILDRRAAIQYAVDTATPGDLVLLAGKGHEKYQEIAGQVLPFDDVAIAREVLEARRRSRVV